MSHGFSTWQLAITPLSPVHIGTGEDYEPTQYVIDGDGLYSFSPEAALRAYRRRRVPTCRASSAARPRSICSSRCRRSSIVRPSV
jgi:CRISPR-associated protein Csm5